MKVKSAREIIAATFDAVESEASPAILKCNSMGDAINWEDERDALPKESG